MIYMDNKLSITMTFMCTVLVIGSLILVALDIVTPLSVILLGVINLVLTWGFCRLFGDKIDRKLKKKIEDDCNIAIDNE